MEGHLAINLRARMDEGGVIEGNQGTVIGLHGELRFCWEGGGIVPEKFGRGKEVACRALLRQGI